MLMDSRVNLGIAPSQEQSIVNTGHVKGLKKFTESFLSNCC